MNHRSIRSLLFVAALTCAAACDAGDGDGNPTEYDLVAHVDLDQLRAADWAKSAFQAEGPIEGIPEACQDLARRASAVTMAKSDEEVSLYIRGQMDPDMAEACAETLRGELGDETERASSIMQITDDLFVISQGEERTSADQLDQILAMAPEGARDRSIWVVQKNASFEDEGHKVERLEGWVDVRKGFEADIALSYDHAAQAEKRQQDAETALAAASLIPDYAPVAKAVTVTSRGKNLRVAIKATPDQMKTLASARGNSKMRYHVGTSLDGDMDLPADLPKSGKTFTIRIGSDQ